MDAAASLAIHAATAHPASARGAGGGSPEAMRKAARDLEAVFVSQMMQHMFSGIETDGLFGGGAGEQMFRSLLVEEYGKQTAQSGGLGLADAMMREMLKMQEAQ